jgi:hypothetical protein
MSKIPVLTQTRGHIHQSPPERNEIHSSSEIPRGTSESDPRNYPELFKKGEQLMPYGIVESSQPMQVFICRVILP